MAGRRLDVALALRRTAAAFAGDFAAVVSAGFALVAIPGIVTRGLAPGEDWATLLTTLRGVLAMVYVALVSWGVVARLAGRRLLPHEFLREGLRRATPGVQVALLAGAAVFMGLTVQLFARHGTLAGWLLDVLLLSAGLWAIAVLMPAVPAAVVERLTPLAALRRAAKLTEGNRDRILGLALVVLLAVAPSLALAAGLAGDSAIIVRAAAELWAWTLVATVPAVVYAGLGMSEP